MNNSFFHEYELITKGYSVPIYQYSTPENQGLAIKKCTILDATDICYSNETMATTEKERGK